MQMTTYLCFRGQCEEAFKFYEVTLGSRIGPIFRYAGTPLAKDSSEAERVFGELAKNGRIVMPLEKTFWAERFCMVVDRFGIPWLINCEGSGETATS